MFGRVKLVVGAAIVACAFAVGMGLAPPAGAVWPGVNGKIVFFKFSFAQFSGQIFSMNSNGTGQKNLSAAGGGAAQLDIQPSVSPNGRFIAFVRLDPSTGSAQLWVMNSDGSGQTDISNDAAAYSESGAAWSPDGSKLLYVQQPSGSFPGALGGPGGGKIFIRNADGSGTPTQLTAGPNDSNPAMSPNGQMIAFSRPVAGSRHLFVMNADGTLTDYGVGSKPDWSPDGSQIVYGQAGAGTISVVNVGDPSSAHILRTGANDAPVWSPDGSQIAFDDCSASGFAGVNCQIAVMSANGLNARDITNEPTLSDQKPDWQAHGNQGHA
jgi:Tol biopolymer transport system component